MASSPIITDMKVIPVAGYDSMLMTLSGAHAPYFTRNLVVLQDSADHQGIGEIHGGDYICESLNAVKPLVVGREIGRYRHVLQMIHRMAKTGENDNGEGIQKLDISKLKYVVKSEWAIECAMLDLLGQFLEVPMAELLGEGIQRQKVEMLGYLFYVSDKSKYTGEIRYFNLGRNQDSMKMKQWGSVALAAVLAAGCMTACSGNTASSNSSTAGGASQSAASATDWPKKTVQVIVPAGAGGDTDFNARTFATYFKKITGQTMVITNQKGGGGSVATSTVKSATADGYTMLFGHTGQLIVNEVAGLIPYNMDSFDIACIPAVDKGTVLVASKASGITSVADLLKKAKEKPGKLLYGSELGGYSNLQGLMLEDKAGISFKIVDTGSASDKVSSLLAGRIDLAAITYGTVKDYKKTGQLNVIGQFNSERNKNLSDIPTLKEGGVDFAMEKPYIIAFPKGTNPAIIKKMSSVAKQVTEDTAYANALKASYNQPISYYDTSDALSLLKSTRTDFMKYKGKLGK